MIGKDGQAAVIHPGQTVTILIIAAPLGCCALFERVD